MSLSNKLKHLRESRGWNRAEVSRQLGLKYTTYVGYENGEREPGHSFLVDVAKLYDVTLDYLLGIDTTYQYQDLVNIHLSENMDTTTYRMNKENLRENERILLSHFGELDDEEQKFFLKQISRAARERGEKNDI